MFKSIPKIFINSFSGLSRDIWLLSLVTLVNRSGTMVILFLTIYLTQELHFSTIQAGLAMSAFGLGSLGGAYIGGWLTDRFGYYPTMFWSLLFGGLSFFVLMQMTTFYSFSITVFIVSLIGDSFRPANLASISVYSKPENHNRSLSLIRMAINLGFSVGSAAAGILSAVYGFHWLFIIDGSTCILGAFFFYFVLEKKEEVKTKETIKEEKKGIGSSAYSDVLYLTFILFCFINAMVFMQLFSTFPLYLSEVYGLTKSEIGYLNMINGLLIFGIEMPLIYILEKRFKRMDLIFWGAVMIGFSYLALNLPGPWYISVVLFILGVSFGEIINFPFSNAFALSRSTVGRRGQFMGLYSMSFSLAFILAPSIGAYIAQNYGYNTLWYTTAALSIVACGGILWLKKLLQKVEVEQKERALHMQVE